MQALLALAIVVRIVSFRLARHPAHVCNLHVFGGRGLVQKAVIKVVVVSFRNRSNYMH